ncbi:acetate--CoA ligase [Leptonema illini]|uniref:Acetyl-coenzyme A synthetase n=1 Tax=Leptonema illini DSM 21528 TaxID=929563 RepID=H2CET7_9LEPT|nr:acetate--CoA ligase [Leptonema illini]EHQ07701.1 acetyl-coenzyme A synthetase [Leptonema illini DSM 21528]
MFESKKYAPSEEFVRNSNLTKDQYEEMYKKSISDPEGFWGEQAERLTWFKKWDKVLEHDFANAKVEWFKGGKLNVAYNCLDRHLQTPAKNKAAIIWVGDKPGETRTYTYQQLHREVSLHANVLKRFGIKRGDRVLIYLPMIPELAIFALACTRIGAVHSVVFGGFSPESLQSRIDDAKPSLIVTSDAGFRGGRIIDMKKNIDEALQRSEHKVQHVIVAERVGNETYTVWNEGRDHHLRDILNSPDLSDECPPEEMDAEDPLFILYTSGSTGKPKGVLHTTGGYLLGANMTFNYVFDHKPDDTFWCTADIGWVTGHSYILYGPLSNGATSLMFEGVPSYPDAGRFWQICDKFGVTVFYTAPTAIRALMREGVKWVEKHRLNTLRLLGSVGEPINPEAWEWYYHNVGKGRCPVVDTWWQTETGSIMISPLPGAIDAKPGSATKPFFGIEPVIVDNDGKELEGAASGNLCIKQPWPSMMRGVYGDPERFFNTYFVQFKGYYFTGDGANRDEDGYYWITGRVDDVLNVSGHRLGSAEVESALVEHQSVAEAAVVGYPHDIKGQGIYAYVTVKNGVHTNDELKKELLELVAEKIGKIARPDVIHWAPGLPKTRSGKIMRRILRKIAEGEFSNLGDISTLADPSVVATLVEDKQKYHS